MTQGHDYDALLRPHGQQPLAHLGPGSAHAPPHQMVPVHEVHSLIHGLRNDMAEIRAHQQRPPQHAPAPRDHEEARYVDHDHRERTERREHRQHHNNEPEYATPRRARQRRPMGPLKFRDFPIGFVQEGIAAGQSAEIEVKPQVSFKGHRLAVASSIARYFNIVDIKVGKDSQLAATGEMPAEAFSALAVGVQMELDCAEPGIVVTLIVRNTDTGTQNFGAVLYGEVEED